MREGWEIKLLNEVYDVRDGTHDSPKYQNEGFPLITSKNLKNGLINFEKVKYISKEDLININKRSKVDIGDVLFAMIGTIGNPTVVINEPNYAIKNVALFKVKGNQNSYFLKYFLESKHVIDKMFNDAKGTTQKFVSLGYLRKFPIPIPPISEQKEIVAILDKAFESIDKAKANIEKNIENAKQLFQSIMLKRFTEGINSNNWPLEKLSKYNEVVVGYVGPISKEYTDSEDGILLLSTKNVNSKGITLEKLTRVNKSFHYKNKKSQLKKGDILVSRHGNSGESAVIPETISEAHALNVIIIKKSDELISEYISYLLNSGVLRKITESKTGSIQEIINTSVIKNLFIPVPSEAIQEVLVQELNELAIKTEAIDSAYSKKLNELEELKKSILQKAFNGELTAKDVAA